MIEITSKALRFARLAAEQQPVFARDPQIEAIRLQEQAFARRPATDRIGHDIAIPADMAEFCFRAMEALLKTPARFATEAWDGNDFVFMKSVARSLQRQLTKTNAQAL